MVSKNRVPKNFKKSLEGLERVRHNFRVVCDGNQQEVVAVEMQLRLVLNES